MSRQYGGIDRVQVDFQPAAVGTSEAKGLIPVKKGDVVLNVHIRRLTLAAGSTTSTISVGDGGDVDRFVAVTDTESGSVDDVVGGVTAAFPYEYTADDNIDADYIIGATPGATNPKVRVVAYIIRQSGN